MLTFFVILKVSYTKYIDNPNNKITKVYFDKKIITNPNFSKLCDHISDTFSWVNSVKNKVLWYKKPISLIQQRYKYIQTINTELINNKSIKINLKFKTPKMTIFSSWYAFNVYDKNNIYTFDTKYLSYKNNIYTFDTKYLSWLNLLSTGVKLYLPSYLSWLNNINDIFWKDTPDKIIKYYKKIKILYPKSKIFYLAWWWNFAVFVDNKKIIFSLSKDIDKQISQLKLLIKKMPGKYNLAKNIDVGNLDEWIYLDVYGK